MNTASPENPAPCGLNCRACMAYADGDMVKHSRRLQELLGPAFGRYAGRFKSFMTTFGGYPQFRALLDFFAEASCAGCRSGECRFPGCRVLECCRARGVDFCFQCGEFPCERTVFDPDPKDRWIAMNVRMKEIGAEAYLLETKDLCRYR